MTLLSSDPMEHICVCSDVDPLSSSTSFAMTIERCSQTKWKIMFLIAFQSLVTDLFSMVAFETKLNEQLQRVIVKDLDDKHLTVVEMIVITALQLHPAPK
jgi:hypothetical protein